MSSEGDAVVAFAARRPGWQLPQLHEGLELASFEPLETKKERQQCPKCRKSKALYCYDCRLPFTPIPAMTLPFTLSIITHGEEQASKNTGVQAAMLAPGFVELHDIEHCPEFEPSRAIVLFPSADALEVAQLEPDSIGRAFIIDSKWKKATELNKHPALAGVRRVKLAAGRSAFWRFHTAGVAEEGVCTVEATYFFLRALQEQGKLQRGPPEHRAPHYFDNLLWYFAYQHHTVQERAAKRMEDRKALAAQGIGTVRGSLGAPEGYDPKERRELIKKQRRDHQQQQQQQAPGGAGGAAAWSTGGSDAGDESAGGAAGSEPVVDGGMPGDGGGEGGGAVLAAASGEAGGQRAQGPGDAAAGDGEGVKG